MFGMFSLYLFTINLVTPVSESSMKRSDSELLDKRAVKRVACLVCTCWLANYGLSLKSVFCVYTCPLFTVLCLQLCVLHTQLYGIYCVLCMSTIAQCWTYVFVCVYSLTVLTICVCNFVDCYCSHGLTFSWWGCYGLCPRLILTELAHSFLFCFCVCFCLYGPFNCISFHNFSRQLSSLSLCSSGLILPLWLTGLKAPTN